MKKAIIGLVVLVLVGVGAWAVTKGPSGQQVSKGDSVDTVNDFYAAPKADSPILSKALRERLAVALADTTKTVDPITCQATAPTAITVRTLAEDAEKSQIIVSPKGGSATQVALVTLLRYNNGWYIDDITCSGGDIAPAAGEFSFEHEGFLLKASVPKPFSTKNWHLVFEENGQAGHLAPLFFSSSSQCTGLDGKTAVCKPDQFKETTKVSVQGELSETGVTVKTLKFVK